MADDNARKALHRLCSIDWSRKESGCKSSIALMKEYLRRAASWGKKLNATDRWPFFDVAKCISESLCAPDELEIPLKQYLTKLTLWPTIKKSCAWYLNWNVLKDRAIDQSVDWKESRDRANGRLDFKAWLSDQESFSPDPYEPLILLYERGGRFNTEHGFINVVGAGIPALISGWSAYHRTNPFVALDEETLDRLDAVPASH
jgi:hypothetical protein